jgi:ABC-2 type transport system permease protein
MSTATLASGWRTAGITATGELLAPGRIVAGAVRLTLRLFLIVFLWRALYAHTTSSAGMSETQAVSYAVLAVLTLRLRDVDRWSARDTVFQHMQYGTIVYWFLRPLAARRYHLLRAFGEQTYGLFWAVLGYVVCLATGVLAPPASAAAGFAFALTFLLGRAVLYLLLLLTDQLCFWTIRNVAAMDILIFTQNLLSGAYAALWFFPGWFRTLSAVLPFQATLNVPLSFYIGRVSVADLPAQAAIQAGWILALTILTRILWRRAADRVVSQGG